MRAVVYSTLYSLHVVADLPSLRELLEPGEALLYIWRLALTDCQAPDQAEGKQKH